MKKIIAGLLLLSIPLFAGTVSYQTGGTGNVLVSIAVNTIINLTGASSPWGNGTSDGTIQGYATGDFLNPALSSQACPFAPNTAIASYVASAAEFNLTGAAPPSNKTNFFLGMG